MPGGPETRTLSLTAEGVALIPGQETKIQQDTKPKPTAKKKKKNKSRVQMHFSSFEIRLSKLISTLYSQG